MGYYYSYYYLVLIGFFITLLAQLGVTSTYKKYKKVQSKKGVSGMEVARDILDKNGLENIRVIETKGELTDHYDPSKKVIKLSSDIYHGTTIAAAAVAAHECGHAIQDKVGYTFMKIRSSIVPMVNFCSKMGYIVIIIGLLFSYELAMLGILLLMATLVFQLVTLPVEFNASSRALKELNNMKLLTNSEVEGSKKMLTAAAFTYVASLITTLLQILRLFLMAQDRRR